MFNDIFRQSAPVHTAVDVLRSLLAFEESVALKSPANSEKFGLTSFGFTQTGTHRTGGTQLWQHHEDLDARFGLDPGLIDAMRAFGILDDREKGGEFYHLYTSVRGSREFFEVVERVGSYAGYGSANSAVRMTAQRSARVHRSRRAIPAV